MTVYLEYALLDNFTMDCLLLFCAAVTLKIPFRKWRLALGAAVGSVTSVATVNVGGWLSYLCKLVCLLSMCIVSVGFGKKLFWFVLLTLLYTFVTGGAILGIFRLLSVEYVTENGFYYNAPVPLFVCFLGVACAVFLCYSVAVLVRQTKKIAPHLKRVKLTLDRTYNLTGFCDSGNTVTCNGVPVCFVTKKFGKVADYFALKVLRNDCEKVRVVTLAGEKFVTAVKATLEVENVSHEIYLALPAQRCATQYELLLSGEFCN